MLISQLARATLPAFRAGDDRGRRCTSAGREAMTGSLTVMFIRHAEQPDGAWPGTGFTDDGIADERSLVIRGWQRAGAWTTLFGAGLNPADYPAPTTIFAVDPTAAGGDGPSKCSAETIDPLAERLGVVPVTTFGAQQTEEVAVALAASDGVVLVCWERKAILGGIIPALLRGQLISVLPSDWDGERFDVVLRFDRRVPGEPWRFRALYPRLLQGDSAVPIDDMGWPGGGEGPDDAPEEAEGEYASDPVDAPAEGISALAGDPATGSGKF